jgi:hypothetical protein
VWGREYGSESDYVKGVVRRLRVKLEPDPAHPRYISPSPTSATVSTMRSSSRGRSTTGRVRGRWPLGFSKFPYRSRGRQTLAPPGAGAKWISRLFSRQPRLLRYLERALIEVVLN